MPFLFTKVKEPLQGPNFPLQRKHYSSCPAENTQSFGDRKEMPTIDRVFPVGCVLGSQVAHRCQTSLSVFHCC